MKKLLRIALLMTVLASLLVIASPAGAVAPDEIQGLVTDTMGAPLNGAIVQLLDAGGNVVATTITPTGLLPAGTYAFDLDGLGLPEGVYSVRAIWQGSDPVTSAPVYLRINLATNPVIVNLAFPLVPAGGELSGVVTDAVAAPIAGATVCIRGTSYWATTDATGAYWISAPNITTGIYEVSISAPGYATQVFNVALAPGAAAVLNAALACADLSGTVVDATGAVVPGATVTVSGPSAATGETIEASTTADCRGVYSFPTLTQFLVGGTLTITASAPGYTARSVTWTYPGACAAPGPGPIQNFTLPVGPPVKVSTPVQLPVLYTTDGWETWIQVQNVADQDVKAVLFLYAESNGFCQEQNEGLLKVTCSGLLHPGAAWTWKISDFPEGDFRSGLVVSVEPGTEPVKCGGDGTGITYCSDLEEVPAQGNGGPIAVTVQRTVIDPTAAGGDYRSSVYKGIPDEAEFGPDPTTGTYMYYAPLIFHDGGGYGWDSDLWIQNSGCECTSVEIWYHSECENWEIAQILALAPGESVKAPKPSWSGIGSAWIRASVPLGIVVDHQDAAKTQLLSYTGFSVHYGAQTGGGPGDWENYGPLIYREYNGWDSGVQVQNMDSTTNALVKVYFLDQSGDIITTLVDWICKRGSQTFYLPAINNLPGMYVGQFRVHSQNWQTPGDPSVPAPKVLSVVNLINYNTGQGLSYNALPAWQAWDETPLADGIVQIALPFLVKQKHDPFEPTGSTWTSKIALTNLIHMSSLSDVVVSIDFFDQNGLLYRICQKLNPKDVDYIDLDDYGVIPPGWMGSALITVQCRVPRAGDPAAIGAVVVNMAEGYASGDLTTGYEAFPIDPVIWVPPGPACIECP